MTLLRPAAHRAPLLHRAASVLLRYPDPPMLAQLDDVAAALPALRPRADRDRLTAVTADLRARTPGEAAERYVATFDHTRRRSLHMTYYRHGDTRARGMALLALKHTYRGAGLTPPEDELPDFLPLMLEFAALAPAPGRRVLLQCRAGLEILRKALHKDDGPYAPVLDALCAGLPELRPGQRDLLHRLTADGPPGERVGLEPPGLEPPGLDHPGLQPFAPPEFLTAPAHLREDHR